MINRIPTCLLLSIARYVGSYDIWHVLDVSRKYRAMWRKIIYATNWYGFETLQLYFEPEVLIRESPANEMWEHFYEICRFGKLNYVESVLMPIILSRPDQDQIWYVPNQNEVFMQIWSYKDDRIWQLICRHIPDKFVDRVASEIPINKLKHLDIIIDCHPWAYFRDTRVRIKSMALTISTLFANSEDDNILHGLSVIKRLKVMAYLPINAGDVYALAENTIDVIDKCIHILLPHIVESPFGKWIPAGKMPRNMHHIIEIFKKQDGRFQGWITHYESRRK